MRHLLKCVIVPTLAMFAAPAFAAGIDGVWACKANGDIPLGLLEIAGDSYSFQSTDTAWKAKDDPSNGGGSLHFDGSRIQPVDGPLFEQFEVYGEPDSGVLYWYNDMGAAMGCWPHGATTPAVARNAPAMSRQTYTAFEIAEKGLELDAAGLTATFRGKTITVTGTLNRFIDTGYGDMVYVAFDHPDTISWEVSCGFPRDNTAEYDRFALMKPGTEIAATGDFLEAQDIYLYFTLLPCQMH